VAQVAEEVVEDAARHSRVLRAVRHLKRAQVSLHQLRRVVQHDFEVRHVPQLVHRVAVEAAAQVVAHAARRHAVQREGRHVEGGGGAVGVARGRQARVLRQQQVQLRRARELGGAAKPAAARVEAAGQLVGAGRDGARLRAGGEAAGRGRGRRELRQLAQGVLPAGADLVLALGPHL
jgi:hypothetical protein